MLLLKKDGSGLSGLENPHEACALFEDRFADAADFQEVLTTHEVAVQAPVAREMGNAALASSLVYRSMHICMVSSVITKTT